MNLYVLTQGIPYEGETILGIYDSQTVSYTHLTLPTTPYV